ncbi:MAG TPA: DUF2867 domain-containing protein [Solirubrobacteraceae bacterium]|nr:DUF2867 domain-containing protein [Solirubrobacteraceae bacterium]
MRLSNSAHATRPWRIHELTSDFRLEDVWALPTPGGRGDFPELVRLLAAGDPTKRLPGIARLLWELRFKLGGLLGWDDSNAGVGSRVPSLRERLPDDLREVPSGPVFDSLPFTSLYLLENEFAAEMANATVHGVMHLGWVVDEAADGFRGQMAVLVKPNGPFGSAYMAAIKPFRYLVVYPAAMRHLEAAWRSRAAGGARARPISTSAAV